MIKKKKNLNRNTDTNNFEIVTDIDTDKDIGSAAQPYYIYSTKSVQSQ